MQRVLKRTQKSFYEVYDHSDSFEPANFTKFGMAAFLAAHSGRSSMALRYLSKIVEPAIRDDRIVYFYNVDGQPAGYYVYALLAPDIDRKLSEIGWTAWFATHHSDWNEGESLWIVDLVAMPGHAKYILRRIRDRFSNVPISYTRIRNGAVLIAKLQSKNL